MLRHTAFTICFLVFKLLSAQWNYVGPKSNSYQFKGLFPVVWADENDLNKVMAGSQDGGLFATQNALSENPLWKNLTDNLPYMNFGVSGIVVKQNSGNKDIYISTSTGGGLLTKSFGNGILHTTNGGETWEHVGPSGTNDHDLPLQGMVANRANQDEMCAFYGGDMYITKDSWKTFFSAKLPFHTDIEKPDITEVEYAPHENGTLYVCTRVNEKNKAQLLVTRDGGVTWKDITPPEIACERIAIATINDPKFKGKFYITSGNANVYVHYFNGKEFSKPLNAQPVTHLGAASFWCLELKANQVDSSVIYLSMTETSMSVDGGKNFIKIAYYNGSNTHADVRDLIVAKSTPHGKGDKVFLANDGGISINNNLFASNPPFKNLNGVGLDANMFWGIDVLQSDSLFIAGGAQDNGGFFIKEKKETNNLANCGDGYYALVLNDSMALNLGNPPMMLLHNFNRNSNSYVGINDRHCEARRPLMIKDSFVYIGYHDIWRARIKDVALGKFDFKNITSIIDVKDGNYLKNREIKGMCISKFNTALIAYANPQYNSPVNSGKLFYCPDIYAKKVDLVDISAINGNSKYELCRWWNVESLAADENDKNTFYEIYKDPYDHKNSMLFKLEYFPDSNKAIVTEITYGLKRVGFNKLKVDKQSGILYVASNDGLYYLDVPKNDTVWKSMNMFPKVIVSDMAFNYHTNKIYVATFGRGIWSSVIPSFNSSERKISKNIIEKDPVKVDGILTLANGKSYTVQSKLIITKGSKISLGKNSKLIIASKDKVRNEKNEVIDINTCVQKHKTAQVIFLKK
jgi:hypothetical protein